MEALEAKVGHEETVPRGRIAVQKEDRPLDKAEEGKKNEGDSNVEDLSFYTQDVGTLYGLIDGASEEMFGKLLKAGVMQGHVGLLNAVINYANVNQLEAKGASEDEIITVIRDVEGFGIDEAEDTQLAAEAEKIYDKYKVNRVTLTKDAYMDALNSSIQNRGFSIDDSYTSVGRLYQQLYGRDFEDAEFGVGSGDDSKPTMVPYNNLGDRLRAQASMIILANKGYHTPMAMEEKR